MTLSHDETRGVQQNEAEVAQRDQEAVQLYEGGLSAREVGLRLGLSTEKVYRLLFKSGVARSRRDSGPSPEMRQRAQEFDWRRVVRDRYLPWLLGPNVPAREGGGDAYVQ